MQQPIPTATTLSDRTVPTGRGIKNSDGAKTHQGNSPMAKPGPLKNSKSPAPSSSVLQPTKNTSAAATTTTTGGVAVRALPRNKAVGLTTPRDSTPSAVEFGDALKTTDASSMKKPLGVSQATPADAVKKINGSQNVQASSHSTRPTVNSSTSSSGSIGFETPVNVADTSVKSEEKKKGSIDRPRYVKVNPPERPSKEYGLEVRSTVTQSTRSRPVIRAPLRWENDEKPLDDDEEDIETASGLSSSEEEDDELSEISIRTEDEESDVNMNNAEEDESDDFVVPDDEDSEGSYRPSNDEADEEEEDVIDEDEEDDYDDDEEESDIEDEDDDEEDVGFTPITKKQRT